MITQQKNISTEIAIAKVVYLYLLHMKYILINQPFFLL